MADGGGPVEVFYSYSHKDAKLRDALETHLALLKRQAVITSWSDRKIGAGDEWRGDIAQHLQTARVILLLISANFLASDYCVDVEMRQAMDRHAAGHAIVIPIYLQPCDWQGMPFGELQGLPPGAKPVTRWANRQEAFASIAKGLRAVIEQLPRLSSRPAKTASRDAGRYYTRGIEHLQNREYDRAISAFDRALALEPRSGSPWVAWEYYHRGLAQYYRGERNSALADWNRTIELDARNAFAYRQRANAYFDAGDDRRALSDYGRAIRLAPEVAKAYYNRGLLHARLDKHEKAVADFRRALAVGNDPETERAAKQQLALTVRRRRLLGAVSMMQRSRSGIRLARATRSRPRKT